jgi:hypothetical protein
MKVGPAERNEWKCMCGSWNSGGVRRGRFDCSSRDQIMEQQRYWRRCVEMSETGPIGCCCEPIGETVESSVGFLSPFSRQLPGLRILDCLSYPLHDSQLQPIVHTIHLAKLSKPNPIKGRKIIDSFFIGDECMYCNFRFMLWRVDIQALCECACFFWSLQ